MRSIRSALCVSVLVLGTHPAIAADVYRGLALPAELAGFERGEMTDFEPRAKGFGMSIRYDTPGIKATVYLYDMGIRGLPEGADNQNVQAQAQQSMRDIEQMHSDVRILEAFAHGPDSCSNFLRTKVSYIEARSGAALHSYLYLGSKKGNFVKLRVSHGAELPFAIDAAKSELRFAQSLCRSVNQ